MIRRLGAVILAAHGLIHLIGFVVPWGLTQVDGFPYRTTALGGAVTLGEPGVRLVGVLWLALAIGFVVAGIGAWRGDPWWVPLTAGLALVSIVVCALGLPEAALGMMVNVGILAVVAWAAMVRRDTSPALG